MRRVLFLLASEHLELLKHGYYEFDGNDQFGSIGLSGKRPFGNSDVIRDMAGILKDKEYIKWCENEDENCQELDKRDVEYQKVYEELATAMACIFQTGVMKAGTVYEAINYNEWKVVKQPRRKK